MQSIRRLLTERGETQVEPDALALFERLARLGRTAGIILVAATQRPSAAALGGLDARTQMTARVSLGVIEARDTAGACILALRQSGESRRRLYERGAARAGPHYWQMPPWGRRNRQSP